ncbi:MAG TPA: ShlB/FhaC/HecB family hemolysin secretion/activation protein [Stellaceae bacterium]|jgi:hemolysin activation/secretion protein
MKSRIVIGCGSAMLLLGLAAPAWAQAPQAPVNAGSAARGVDQTRQNAPVTNPQPVPVLPQVTEPQFTLPGNQTLHVNSIVVDGPMLVDAAALRAILAPYEGRDLGIGQIHEAADKVSNLYRAAGYLVATAYVPAQDARGGTLHFTVIPGKYGDIKIENNSLVNTDRLQSTVASATAGSPYITSDTLERAMLLISDLPGAGTPRSVMSAGRQPETSDFLFQVPEARRIDGYALADNYGSPFTGRVRFSGGVNLNSPLGFGDRLSVSGLVTHDTNLWNGRVAYSFPIGSDGLRAEIGAYRTSYDLGGIFRAVHATGIADAVTATLSYPLVRQIAETITISGNYTHSILNDKVLGTSISNRSSDTGTVGVTAVTAGAIWDLPLTTNSALSITEGDLVFANSTQNAFNVAGPNTAGDFTKINGSFDGTMALFDRLSFEFNLRAQVALTGNLDPYQQLGLTGAYGIRSYDEDLNGDSGYIATPTLKYALPDFMAYRHSVGLFTDTGGVWLSHPGFTTVQRPYTQLNDIGVGYYGTYEYQPGRIILLKAVLVHSYGGTNGAQFFNRGTRALLQAGLTF